MKKFLIILMVIIIFYINNNYTNVDAASSTAIAKCFEVENLEYVSDKDSHIIEITTSHGTEYGSMSLWAATYNSSYK